MRIPALHDWATYNNLITKAMLDRAKGSNQMAIKFGNNSKLTINGVTMDVASLEWEHNFETETVERQKIGSPTISVDVTLSAEVILNAYHEICRAMVNDWLQMEVDPRWVDAIWMDGHKKFDARRIWADELDGAGNPVGELIRCQCQVEETILTGPDTLAKCENEKLELLAQLFRTIQRIRADLGMPSYLLELPELSFAPVSFEQLSIDTGLLRHSLRFPIHAPAYKPKIIVVPS